MGDLLWTNTEAQKDMHFVVKYSRVNGYASCICGLCTIQFPYTNLNRSFIVSAPDACTPLLEVTFLSLLLTALWACDLECDN